MCRKKAIVGPVAVNVYAVGLYVDAAAAKCVLVLLARLRIPLACFSPMSDP